MPCWPPRNVLPGLLNRLLCGLLLSAARPAAGSAACYDTMACPPALLRAIWLVCAAFRCCLRYAAFCPTGGARASAHDLSSAIVVMPAPEDNRVAIDTFARALKLFTGVNCLVYDRMCKLTQAAAKMDEFKNIRSWSMSKFHAQKHKPGCKCNPIRIRKLAVRFAKMNATVCEQTFARFRRYGITCKHSQPLRHRFMVLNDLARHNQFVLDGHTSYLSPMIRTSKKRKATPYEH